MGGVTGHDRSHTDLPAITRAAREPTYASIARDETGAARELRIAGEHPLTIYLNKRELVTLMTLGGAPEELVLGYLRNQRLVHAITDVAAVQVDWEIDSAAVTMRDPDYWERHLIDRRTASRTVTTGCGQGTVFGDLMDEIETLRLPAGPGIDASMIPRVAECMRGQQSIYKQAGAVHGCALLSGAAAERGEPLIFIEDVGRHNAVDAIAGRMWLDRIDGSDKWFYSTGRLTSEMVIKCAQMGVPVLLSRSGITRMGHELAQRLGLTLIGRCVGRHFLVFVDHGRVRFP